MNTCHINIMKTGLFDSLTSFIHCGVVIFPILLAGGLAAEETADGFVDMFNGKDLTGWQTTGNWVVEENNVITLKGGHLVVVLNGEQIQDLDLAKTDLKDRPAKGHISFQDEGKRIWYRNVRIKELDSPEP